jgi:hypothetical protein
MNEQKSIVKFQDKFWLVHEKRGEMLVLWRDGRRAIVPESLIKYITVVTEKGE